MPVAATQKISIGFGNADSGKTYPIPVATQPQVPGVSAPASFADGFPPLTRTPISDEGVPPNGEDVNGILYMISQNMALVCSGQPFQFDAAQAAAIGGYDKGAVLLSSTGTGYWINTVAGNSTNPDTGGAGWAPALVVGDAVIANPSGSYTLTPAQYSKPIIFLTGTLTANLSLKFPAGFTAQWLVVNEMTVGVFNVTANVLGGTTSTVAISAGGANAPTSVYSDGANLWNTGVSTAGLAPIASPSFTGNPTTVTPAASSNTTQIANTAWVRGYVASALTSYAPLASPELIGTPSAPTASPGTNNAVLANTAFVQAAITAAIAAIPPSTVVKRGTFSSVAGVVDVSFGFTFAGVPSVVCQWAYANPDVGWIVPGSITTTGFQYQTGNSGTVEWIAAY